MSSYSSIGVRINNNNNNDKPNFLFTQLKSRLFNTISVLFNSVVFSIINYLQY